MTPGARMIANARMYSIDAATSAHWRALLEWVIARANVPVDIVDHPAPRRLSDLWQRTDLACAFMCGYPLTKMTPRPIALAAVVPSPSRYASKAIYWSDLVVRADAPWRSIEDVIGRRVAYTLEHSQSGYQAMRRFFAEHAARDRSQRLFQSTVGPLVTPRDVVRVVTEGDADVGPIDSYAHDLLRKHEPHVAARLRILATTMPTPIPPFVASAHVPEETVHALREALLDAGRAAELAATREALLIERFEAVSATDYQVLARLASEADALGYAQVQ